MSAWEGTDFHCQLLKLMGAQNETLDLSQSALRVQPVRIVVRRTKDTYWNCLCVNFKILSNSAKCPVSIILSASSKTRNRRFFTSSASSSSCSGPLSVYNQDARLALPLRGYPIIAQGLQRGHRLLVLVSVAASVLTSRPRLRRRSRVAGRGASTVPSYSPC
jgi:hypothetical protein